jgi:hypothetical protein
MPAWAVQPMTDTGRHSNGHAALDSSEQRLEAELLLVEAGTLVALDQDGNALRMWAPGTWTGARQVSGVEAHPAGTGLDAEVVELPRQRNEAEA